MDNLTKTLMMKKDYKNITIVEKKVVGVKDQEASTDIIIITIIIAIIMISIDTTMRDIASMRIIMIDTSRVLIIENMMPIAITNQVADMMIIIMISTATANLREITVQEEDRGLKGVHQVREDSEVQANIIDIGKDPDLIVITIEGLDPDMEEAIIMLRILIKVLDLYRHRIG